MTVVLWDEVMPLGFPPGSRACLVEGPVEESQGHVCLYSGVDEPEIFGAEDWWTEAWADLWENPRETCVSSRFDQHRPRHLVPRIEPRPPVILRKETAEWGQGDPPADGSQVFFQTTCQLHIIVFAAQERAHTGLA